MIINKTTRRTTLKYPQKTTRTREPTINTKSPKTPTPDENAYPIPATTGTNRTEGHIVAF